jgi:hypothetical protein
MPTNFPTSVDNFTNPTANDSLNLPSHSTQHANANDAIEAVEDYLLNGSAWTSYTPVVTPQTGVFFVLTVNHAVYQRIGKTCHLNISFTMTSVGSASGLVNVTLPFTAKRAAAGVGAGREVAVTGNMLQVSFYGSDVTQVGIARYDNNSAIGANHQPVISLTYEIL